MSPSQPRTYPGTPAIHRRQLISAAAGAVVAGMAFPLRAAEPPLLIGQSVPLSGPLMTAFKGPLAGQQLAIDELNRQGGIGGRPVKIVILDDGYDTARTVENVKQLVETDKVVALTALGSTAGIGAVLPYIAQKRLPMVGSWSGAHVLRLKPHPCFFTSQGSFADEVEHSLRTLVTLKMDQIGVAFQDNAFGQLVMPMLQAKAKELGATLLSTASLAVDGSNAAEAAKTLTDAKVNAVMLIAVGPSVAAFVMAAKANLRVPIYTLSVSTSSVAPMGAAARGLAMTQIVPFPWRKVDPMARDFNRLADAAKVPVDYGTYGGYLGARFLIESLERASPRITPETIITAVESIKDWSLGGNRLNFSPTRHHGNSWAEITIVGPDGKFLR
jgi:branched-chain amino acid transport system substrate-binding protein